MKNRFIRVSSTAIALVAAASLAGAAQAQGAGGGGGQGMPGIQQGSGAMDQIRQQDRLQTPDRDRDRLRDQDRLRDPDQLRDRDRDRLRDPDVLRDRDRLQIHRNVDGQLDSMRLLTDAERQRFRSQIRDASTEQERSRIRAEHQETIRQRAGDLGVNAPFGPDRSGNGSTARAGYMLAQMLSEQERLEFHQRMRAAGNEEERARIRNEMQVTARERAALMGVDIPEWYGARQGQ